MRLCFCLLVGGWLAGPAATAQTLRTTGPPVPIVADAEAALHPVWSPDGARLAFTRAGYRGLWVVDADGRNARALADWPAAGFGFSWSPDGGAILARPAQLDGLRRRNAVAVVDVATGARAMVADWREAPLALPHWASATEVAIGEDDARPVARVGAVPDAARQRRLAAVLEGDDGLVLRLPDGTRRRLADGRTLNATLSPDGRLVAYEELGGGLVVVGADGGGRVELGPGHRPSWSPDGRWLVCMVTTDDGHDYTSADLVAVRADGSARVALTATPDRLEMNPSWSPDGRRIAFDDLADGALYVLPVTE